jgi:hypothetical protein
MGALAVNQLLSSSQDKGVELTLETAPLENQVSIIWLFIFFIRCVCIVT